VEGSGRRAGLRKYFSTENGCRSTKKVRAGYTCGRVSVCGQEEKPGGGKETVGRIETRRERETTRAERLGTVRVQVQRGWLFLQQYSYLYLQWSQQCVQQGGEGLYCAIPAQGWHFLYCRKYPAASETVGHGQSKSQSVRRSDRHCLDTHK
jgi:hypothetical protein